MLHEECEGFKCRFVVGYVFYVKNSPRCPYYSVQVNGKLQILWLIMQIALAR